jgi:hypothetical protein
VAHDKRLPLAHGKTLQPSTLNPQPATLNPKPSTLKPKTKINLRVVTCLSLGVWPVTNAFLSRMEEDKFLIVGGFLSQTKSLRVVMCLGFVFAHDKRPARAGHSKTALYQP